MTAIRKPNRKKERQKILSACWAIFSKTVFNCFQEQDFIWGSNMKNSFLGLLSMSYNIFISNTKVLKVFITFSIDCFLEDSRKKSK